jgi:hypothetical protein
MPAQSRFYKLKDYEHLVKKDDKAIAKAVAKAIRDNLKGWTAIELRGNRDAEGYCCEQRLTDMKTLYAWDSKRFPVSKFFYQDLKIYRSDTAPGEALKVVNKDAADDDIAPELLKAFKRYMQNGDRGLVIHALMLVESLNALEANGVLQFALQCEASTSPEQARIVRSSFRILFRLEFNKNHPDLLKCVKSWLDESWLHLWTLGGKGNSTKPGKFIMNNEPAIYLLLPEDACNAVKVVADDNFAGCQQQLMEVVSSSDTGMSMFGFAVERVIANTVETAIRAEAAKLRTRVGVLTTEALENAKIECLEQVQKLPGVDFLPEKRSPSVQYRSRTYQVQIKGIWMNVDVAFECEWKTMAVSSGDLAGLYCEDDLVEGEMKFAKGLIGEDVLRNAASVRAGLNGVPLAEDGTDGLSIVALLKKKEKNTMATDPSFAYVEKAFFFIY